MLSHKLELQPGRGGFVNSAGNVGRLNLGLLTNVYNVESVAVRVRTQQSRRAANNHGHNQTLGRPNSKETDRRKNAGRQQAKSRSHFLGVYVTPSPEDSAGRSTIEEHAQ